jgi:hypothetical protein
MFPFATDAPLIDAEIVVRRPTYGGAPACEAKSCPACATASLARTAPHRRPPFDPFAITGIEQAQTKQNSSTVSKTSALTSNYHNPDYTVLVGRLECDSQSSVWRLRYCDANAVDLFGGSVTFAGAGNLLQGYHQGELVLVVGEIANLEKAETSPAYRVRHIWPIQD